MSRRSIERLAVFAPVLAIVVAGWCARWTCDDAFIDYRVVRNLLDGLGPVFNAGERVEAYTSPLWVALLAAAVAPWKLAHASRLPLEWASVLLGIAASALGLGAASAGWLRLARERGDDGPSLPVAAWIMAALPAAWGFATSGLEPGLVLAWIGGAFFLIAARRRASALVIGLGPLVRPDLATLALAFCVMAAAREQRGTRRRAAIFAQAAAPPVLYQIFRMGYFAAVVPNTALAKEAFQPYWSQGWKYLADFALPYQLWIPLALVATLAILRRRELRASWPAYAVAAGGLLHGLGVVRWGGDFMHARLLLPSLFALTLPFGLSLRPRGERWIAALLGAWALACALWLRVPYGGRIGPDEIADERSFYVLDAAVAHPILAGDFARGGRSYHIERGHAYASFRERDALWSRCFLDVAKARRVIVTDAERLGADFDCARMTELPLAPGVAPSLVALAGNIGITAYGVGADVHVVDFFGLADPIVSRFRLVRRGRPGHEKGLPGVKAWMVARFADPAAPWPARHTFGVERVAAARDALACGPLAELLAAVEEPLTARRFAKNFRDAWRFSRLRFSNFPDEARAELCPAR